MALRANNKGDGDFELMPQDTHMAVCYGVIDLGTQRAEFQGKEKLQHKIILLFEVPSCTIEIDGEEHPMVISKEYSASTHEKSNLYKDLVSWRGRNLTPEEAADFDLTALAGKPCQIQVVHKKSAKGRDYAFINAVIKFPNGVPPLRSVNDPIVYELTKDYIHPDIPEWIQDKIKASLEFTGERPFEEEVPEEVSDVEPF